MLISLVEPCLPQYCHEHRAIRSGFPLGDERIYTPRCCVGCSRPSKIAFSWRELLLCRFHVLSKSNLHLVTGHWGSIKTWSGHLQFRTTFEAALACLWDQLKSCLILSQPNFSAQACCLPFPTDWMLTDWAFCLLISEPAF